jgi:hypothetical protein
MENHITNINLFWNNDGSFAFANCGYHGNENDKTSKLSKEVLIKIQKIVEQANKKLTKIK